jgi:hypothetical protein
MTGLLACDAGRVAAPTSQLSLSPEDAKRVNIFVDRNATGMHEDGTAAAPFHTITRALERARAVRFGSLDDGTPPSSAVIQIHVAASSTPYVGSFNTAVFDPASPSYDPRKEKLPLLLNIPALVLRGETELTQTSDGLPDAVVPGTETIIRADQPQGQKQYLVMVTRTLPLAGSGYPETLEMAGDDVTILGLWLQADRLRVLPSALIAMDGVSGFVVRRNVLEKGGNGVWARLSSGRIHDNLALDNTVSFYLTAGSRSSPAHVRIVGNRAVGAGTAVAGLNLLGAGDNGNRRVGLDLGPNRFRRVPIRAVLDRTAHADSIPDRLSAEVSGNEFRGMQFGMRVNGYLQDPYTVIAGQEETANVTAIFRDNVSRSNSVYGLVVDAGQIPKGERRAVALELSFDGTRLSDNTLGPAIISFWRFGGSIAPASDLPFLQPNPSFAVNSTIRICGDVTQFHYDNRQNPDAATNPPPLNNRLTVNDVALEGLVVDHVFAVPAASPACN